MEHENQCSLSSVPRENARRCLGFSFFLFFKQSLSISLSRYLLYVAGFSSPTSISIPCCSGSKTSCNWRRSTAGLRYLVCSFGCIRTVWASFACECIYKKNSRNTIDSAFIIVTLLLSIWCA